MTAHGDSSGPDEREIANPSANPPANTATNSTATTTGRRRRPPTASRPGMRVRRRPRAAVERPAAPQSLNGELPLPGRPAALPAVRRHIDLGPVRLSLLDLPAPPASVEVAGASAGGRPRIWHLVFAGRRPLVVEPQRGPVRLESGSVMPWEPEEPLRISAGTDTGAPARALVLHLPEEAVPLAAEALRDLNGRPVPTGSGPAALLASFVHGLAAHPPSEGAPYSTWLGGAAANLAAAFLGSRAAPPRAAAGPRPAAPAARPAPSARPSRPPAPSARPSRPPAPSGTEALLDGIKAYIERHLSDPELTPTAIAAAGHVSLRYLHHLFQRDGRTVGAFLRERRLEHCRADLSDPALAARGVCEIARRWGFRDPAVFNRTFKSAYGMTPGRYREHRQRTTR
ncbi:helix-turn-helix transcriptional regulator [Streptomyces sp. NPDC020917]|uniref:helix-turn-helix transcriptional regulator n=1 Tax=Streptomyces sp. NPDC020917 TaxID=3365102 RepID=UPI0037B92C54